MAALTHPTLAELLLWQSGELSVEHGAEVQRHIAACEECQATLAELESLYGDIGVVSDQDAHFRFHEALQERQKPFWRRFRFVPRWTAVTASVVIAALLLVAFTEYTPSARAETLLTRAAKEEATGPEHPYLLKIQAAGMSCNVVVRHAAAVVSIADSDQSFCGHVTANLHNAGWSWNDLLSARSFKRWRDGLQEKKDTIRKSPDATEVTTTTADGPLQRATLRLRSSDYRPMQARFVFASIGGEEQPEFEVAESEDIPQEIAASVSAPSPSALRPEPSPTSLPTVDPMDANEAEVRLALHRIGADKSVLLDVKRTPDAILVSGIVPDAQAAPITTALAAVPHVDTRVGSQGSGQSSTAWQNFHGDAPPLALEQINSLYPNDPQARRDFINNLDTVTLRLAGEARSRDALLALAKQPQTSAAAMQLRSAAADLEADITADLASLASALQPLVGRVRPQAGHLTFGQATQLYTLVHELVSMNKSDNALGLPDTFDRVRRLISGS